MFTWIKSFFGCLTAEDVLKDQLHEAELLCAEHVAAAEHHECLATMYRERAMRITGQLHRGPVQIEPGAVLDHQSLDAIKVA